MKTNLLANLANKTFAFATVIMMGLAFVACSGDEDKNAGEDPQNGKVPQTGKVPQNDPKPMTVTIDNVDKKVVDAEYKNLGNNNYSISLYLSSDSTESVVFNLNTELHMNKDINLTKVQESNGHSWRVEYNNKEGQQLIVSDGMKKNGANLFSEGKLELMGDPNETMMITLTKGKVIGRDKLEHTILISYKATSLNDANFVDLGYGVSVKWATCNLGTSSPEKLGDRYAWGEIQTKTKYEWSNYKWAEGTKLTLTKYNTNKTMGKVDNVTTLEPEDDAVTAHYKSKRYRMPTKKEIQELIQYCQWTWTSVNKVKGYKVTGHSGKSIFLPATSDGFDEVGKNAYQHYSLLEYWSGALYGNLDTHAHILWCKISQHKTTLVHGQERCMGLCIRPVRQ